MSFQWKNASNMDSKLSKCTYCLTRGFPFSTIYHTHWKTSGGQVMRGRGVRTPTIFLTYGRIYTCREMIGELKTLFGLQSVGPMQQRYLCNTIGDDKCWDIFELNIAPLTQWTQPRSQLNLVFAPTPVHIKS